MEKFFEILKQRVAAAALLVVAAFGLQTKVAAQDDKTLLGAGSSFINPFFSKIFADYNAKNGYTGKLPKYWFGRRNSAADQ